MSGKAPEWTGISEKIRHARKIAFLKQLTKFPNIAWACRTSGVPSATVYRWKDEDPDFKESWLDAIEIAVGEFEHAGFVRARDGESHPVYDKAGKQTGVRVVHFERTWSRIMEAYLPDRYGRKHDVTVRTPEEAAQIANAALGAMDGTATVAPEEKAKGEEGGSDVEST